MSALDGQEGVSAEFASAAAPDIYIRTPDDNVHRLDNISDRLKQEIGSYCTSDRDVHPDGGFVYYADSLQDQAKFAELDTLSVREIDAALNDINPDLVTPDGPPSTGNEFRPQ